MAKSRTPPLDDAKPLVGASMFGITMPCVDAARKRLEDLGYEVVVFHQTGVGGRSLEELIQGGMITAVLDVTTTELADELVGGICPAVPGRLETAGRLGIPQVVTLGALDFVCMGALVETPEQFSGRTFHRHAPEMIGMRTTPEECAELGRTIARKLSAATGPTAIFVPLRGVSVYAAEGQVFYDPAADEALFEAVRESVDRARVEVHELDLHINDPEFALAMANRLHELYRARMSAVAVQPTKLIGRGQDLAALHELLAGEERTSAHDHGSGRGRQDSPGARARERGRGRVRRRRRRRPACLRRRPKARRSDRGEDVGPR